MYQSPWGMGIGSFFLGQPVLILLSLGTALGMGPPIPTVAHCVL